MLLESRPLVAGDGGQFAVARAAREAAKVGAIALAERLLEEPLGAEVKLRVLCEAMQSCTMPLVVKLLCDPEVDLARDGDAALIAAIHHDSHRDRMVLLETLLSDPRIDVKAHGGAALAVAVQRGARSQLQRLLADSRVDAGTFDSAALRLAADAGSDSSIITLLAHPSVVPSARSNEALWLAARKKHYTTVSLLLADPRVDPAGCCRAASCTCSGACDCLVGFTRAGADIAAVSAAHNASASAAGGGPAPPAQAAAAEHADVHADAAGAAAGDDDSEGSMAANPAGAGRKCAAAAAAYAGSLYTVQLLLADPRAVEARCFDTALVAAAQAADGPEIWDRTEVPRMIEWLLASFPVSPAACSRALREACKRKQVAEAEQLLADPLQRADPLAVDADGLDALDWAIAHYDLPEEAMEPDLGLPGRIDLRDRLAHIHRAHTVDILAPDAAEAAVAAEQAAVAAKMAMARVLVMEPAVLHSRLRCGPASASDWHPPARLWSLDLKAESLAGRAWMRRRHPVAARVRALEGDDSD